MKITLVFLAGCIVLVVLLSLCSVADHHPLPVAQYDSVEINVYLRQGEQRFRFLGSVTGVDACHALAEEFLKEKGLSDKNWEHVCCTIREGSHCYDEIK